LNIDLINANTCQAKGPVEWANKTLQDRLIKELRLQGISTAQEANKYLPKFIQMYNQKFAKPARSSNNVHRCLQKHARHKLEEIFSWQEERTLSYNLTVQYDKVSYWIEDSVENRTLARKRVKVYDDYQGQIKIKYEGRELPYRRFDKIRQVEETAIVEEQEVR
jgi:hypothetical protein